MLKNSLCVWALFTLAVSPACCDFTILVDLPTCLMEDPVQPDSVQKTKCDTKSTSVVLSDREVIDRPQLEMLSFLKQLIWICSSYCGYEGGYFYEKDENEGQTFAALYDASKVLNQEPYFTQLTDEALKNLFIQVGPDVNTAPNAYFNSDFSGPFKPLDCLRQFDANSDNLCYRGPMDANLLTPPEGENVDGVNACLSKILYNPVTGCQKEYGRLIAELVVSSSYTLTRAQTCKAIDDFTVPADETKEKKYAVVVSKQTSTSQSLSETTGVTLGLSSTESTGIDVNADVSASFMGLGGGVGVSTHSSTSITNTSTISRELGLTNVESSSVETAREFDFSTTFKGGKKGSRYVIWQFVDIFTLKRDADDEILVKTEIYGRSQLMEYNYGKTCP